MLLSTRYFNRQLGLVFLGWVFFTTPILANAQQTSGLVSNIFSNTTENETDFTVFNVDQSAAIIHNEEADWKIGIGAIKNNRK
ncbi:MAG: hypothetical protein ACERKD_15060 [Prolixibacteraceae bacterium]